MIRKPQFKLNWKYALGEIALIFIGISLAIAVQNWNEERRENIQLKGYLSAIQKNLQADTAAIKAQDRRYKRNQKMADAYLRNLFLDQYAFDTLGLALNAIAEQYLSIDQSGFEALKSSGYISKLQGLEMEEKLFQYYSFYNTVVEQEKSLNNFIESMEVRLFDMDSETLINVFRIFNVTDIQNTGEITQPIAKIAKTLYTNSHVIGVLQRTADEDSRQYEIMLENAEELLLLIQKELDN